MKKWNARQFTDVEAAWLAAVIDGEGSIGLYKRDPARHDSILIQMCNTSEAFVVRMREVIGGGNICYRSMHNDSHKGRKPIWHYKVWGIKNGVQILKQIRPFLIIKAEKADKILAAIDALNQSKSARDEIRSRQRSALTIKQWENPEIRRNRIQGLRTYFARKAADKATV